MSCLPHTWLLTTSQFAQQLEAGLLYAVAFLNSSHPGGLAVQRKHLSVRTRRRRDLNEATEHAYMQQVQ